MQQGVKRTQHVTSHNSGVVGQQCCVRLHGLYESLKCHDHVRKRQAGERLQVTKRECQLVLTDETRRY